MKRLLNLLVLVILVNNLFAQTSFQRVYGVGMNAFTNTSSLNQTFDGGYILTGTDSTNAAWNRDVYLLRLNAAGDTIWGRSYGTAGFEFGQYAIQTLDSGFIVVGASLGSDWNVYILKTDKNGDTLWTRGYGSFGDDEAYSVKQLADSGYIICGYTTSHGAGNYDYFLMKLNANGGLVWSKAYGTIADELAYYAEPTLDKGYIISGASAAGIAASIDAYAIKTDSTGAVEWAYQYGTAFTDFGYMMKQTRDSGFILTGYASSGINSDIMLIKTNKLGDTLWTRTYGGNDPDKGLCVIETADSGYAIGGTISSNSLGANDALLLKTDGLGNMQYCHGFGGNADDAAPAIMQTADKGFVLGAYTNSLTGGAYFMYLVKTDTVGDVTGLCNEVHLNPLTIQRSFTVTSVATIATPFVFQSMQFTTEIDTGYQQYTPCASMGLEVNGIGSSLKVYPNPATTFITLEAENTWNTTIEVYDMIGNLVYHKTAKNNTGTLKENIDVSRFAPGTYFLNLNAGSGMRSVRLVVAK